MAQFSLSFFSDKFTAVRGLPTTAADADAGGFRTGLSSTLTMLGCLSKSFSTARPLQG